MLYELSRMFRQSRYFWISMASKVFYSVSLDEWFCLSSSIHSVASLCIVLSWHQLVVFHGSDVFISSLYDISSIQNIRYFWWGQDIWYFVYIQLFVGDIFCSVLMTLLIFCWCWVGYCIRFHEELTDVCCCVSDAEEIVLWSSLPSIKEKDFMYSEKTHIILCMEKIGNKLRVLSQSSVTSLKKNKT